jgi:hypothetical protein
MVYELAIKGTQTQERPFAEASGRSKGRSVSGSLTTISLLKIARDSPLKYTDKTLPGPL